MSSNAGDLTPPQTSVSEQSFFTLEEDNETTSTPKHSEKDSSPAVVMLTSNDLSMTSGQVQFGFEVNILDFIGNLNDDDNDAITFEPMKNNSKSSTLNSQSSTLNSPESGIGSIMSASETLPVPLVPIPAQAPCARRDNFEPPIIDAVKIPNYAQVIQFLNKQWRQVEKEIKQGTVHQF